MSKIPRTTLIPGFCQITFSLWLRPKNFHSKLNLAITFEMPFPTGDKHDIAFNTFARGNNVGTVRIAISSLQFPKDSREIDDCIVDNLIRVFRKTRCRRYDPENHIVAVITNTALRRALTESGLKQSALAHPAKNGSFHLLHLPPGHKLQCLYGQHRTKAGEMFLPYNDRWWTVQLHEDSTSQ